MSSKGKTSKSSSAASKVVANATKVAPSPKLVKPEPDAEVNDAEENQVTDVNEDHEEANVEENGDAEDHADADAEAEANAEENGDAEAEAEENGDADADADAEENEAEDAEEADDDAEETAEEPTKKATKKAAKPAAKGKTKAKSSTGGSRSKKDNDVEDELHTSRMKSAAELNLVTYFPEMAHRNSNDKWANALSTHILEGISHLQQAEVRKEGDYNPFPASEYFLYEDQIKGKEEKKAKGKSVKTKAGSVPSKPNLPIKRGQKANAVPEPEPDHEDEDEDIEVDETDETDESNDSDKKENKEDKTPPRKRIVKFSKQTKSYLGFILTRGADEIYCTDANSFKTAKSNEDFTKQVFTKISKDTGSQISRVMVCTVNEHRGLVANYSEGQVKTELQSRLSAYFQDRVTVFNHFCTYAAEYIKLLAHHLAMQLWLSSRPISVPMLETAMRSLALGNHRYMIENKFITEEEDDCGITRGVMNDARAFDRIVNPPPVLSEEEKQKREAAKAERKAKAAARSKAAKEKKAAEEAKNGGKATTKKGSKGAGKKDTKPASKGKKGKKVVDEPEEDAEAEAEEEPDAEDAEAEAEAEPEEAEPAEAEAEEEDDKPKKSVKALPKATKKATTKKSGK